MVLRRLRSCSMRPEDHTNFRQEWKCASQLRRASQACIDCSVPVTTGNNLLLGPLRLPKVSWPRRQVARELCSRARIRVERIHRLVAFGIGSTRTTSWPSWADSKIDIGGGSCDAIWFFNESSNVLLYIRIMVRETL